MLERDPSDLGPEIFRCRPLTSFQSLGALRGRFAAGFMYFFVLPVVGIPLLSFYFSAMIWLISVGVTWLFTGNAPTEMGLVCWLMPVFYLPIFWLTYLHRWTPNQLVVHERGISGNGVRFLGRLQPFAVRFEDIECIQIGRKIRWTEKVIFRVASLEDPTAPADLRWRAANSGSLVLRDHPELSLGILLTRFDAADINAFIDLVGQKVAVRDGNAQAA